MPDTQTKKPSKLKSALSIVSHFVSTFLVALIVMLAVILVAVRFGGCTLLNVESGSMQPYLDVGTLVIVKEVDCNEIETGDVITYVMNADLMLVTHRVVYVDKANETFTTKGDANNSNDPNPILWANVVGKVVFKVPKVGAIVSTISAEENRKYVIAFIIFLIALLLVGDSIEKAWRSRGKQPVTAGQRNVVSAKPPAETEHPAAENTAATADTAETENTDVGGNTPPPG